MRRLFWTFPDGLPGGGLLLMRVTIGGALLARCPATWPTEPVLPVVLCGVESLSAVLLFAGAGTPIWGSGAAAVELCRVYSDPADVLVHVLLATIGAALALLGPGAFSVDARVFGWRRIDVRGRASKGPNDHSN